ncbi:MAG: SH3 domain-containing protein [Candidatus Dormibacteria bacterium]|jgi:hypothetical protein
MGKAVPLLSLALPVVAGLLLATAGCSSSSGPSPSPRQHSPRPTASVTPAATQLTVIAPLGVYLRSGPAATASVLGALAQGVTLPILSHTIAAGGWWQVQGATESGWVTADPQYTSTAGFETYQAGGSVPWSVMYEDSWTFAQLSSGELRFTSSGRQNVTFYTASSVSQLPAAAPAGDDQKSVSSVEVYGVTAALVTYVSPSAYQASVELQAQPSLAFLITAQLSSRSGAATLNLFLETVFFS